MPARGRSEEGGDEALVAVERDGAVALLTLNRPAKLNAISSQLEEALWRALESDAVTTSRAVVVTGGAKVFSAGADVTEMRNLDAGEVFRYYAGFGNVYEKVAALPQPSVSAIAGYCLGGGLELALATDFRVAEATAVLGFPELDIGIIPSSGGVARVVSFAGPAIAREVVLLRRRFSAAEGLSAGLVTEVVDAGEGLRRALEIAALLAELPELATTLARRAIDAAAKSAHDVSLLVEQLTYAALVQGGESQDRIGAFSERGAERGSGRGSGRGSEQSSGHRP